MCIASMYTIYTGIKQELLLQLENKASRSSMQDMIHNKVTRAQFEALTAEMQELRQWCQEGTYICLCMCTHIRCWM